MRTVDKVIAFITRWQNKKPELLVVQHSLTGRQLPAGTVEMNEPLEMALLRKLAEETRLVDFEISTYLGSRDSILTGNDYVILVTTKLFSSPSNDASSEGYILERGLPVQLTDEIGKYSAVRCDPRISYQLSPTRRQDVSGYVRSSVMGRHIRRHFFQLKLTTRTPEKWQIQVDGNVLELCWLSLDPQPILSPDHSNWLDSIYEVLITDDSPAESMKSIGE